MFKFHCFDSVFTNSYFDLTCDFYCLNNDTYELHTFVINKLTQKEIITLINKKFVLSILDLKKGVRVND